MATDFMSTYANDLLNGRKEAIVKRYDPRGCYRVGQGKKSFETPEDTRMLYGEKWHAPASFTGRTSLTSV